MGIWAAGRAKIQLLANRRRVQKQLSAAVRQKPSPVKRRNQDYRASVKISLNRYFVILILFSGFEGGLGERYRTR